MQKKVILIGPAHPYRGGIAAFNERLAKALQEDGCEVEMYSFKMQYPKFLFPGKTQYSDAPVPKHLRIYSLLNSVNPINWIKVGLKLKKLKPKLIIISFWHPFMAPCFGTIARIAKRNKQTKVITIAHNIVPHETGKIDKLLSAYFVHSLDGAITLAKSVLNDLKAINRNIPARHTPHPVYDHFGTSLERNEAIKKLNLDNKFSYILFFGIIRHYKGLDILLHALADKRIRKLPVKLIIAGEYYVDSSPYKEIIKQYELEGNVINFEEFISDVDVKYFFSAADLIVQPYKTATQSGVAQIAYHFDKPMLVTNVGGLAEIVPHMKVGYVVEPEPKEVAASILDFYEKNRSEEFTLNIKKEKKRFAWSTFVDVVHEMSEKINR